MDPDLVITIAFCAEVFLFVLVTGVFVVHEVRQSRSEATAERTRARLERAEAGTWPRPSADAARPATRYEDHALRDSCS
jgi:hypothetical protein